ncbi:MAG TPA: exosortase system-associated protein, TIGR04073 family [Candidatus Udaeobacter sp.]|jgi:putative exosortase-associated protein (TIGR04073 family)|nr:exosortase system-associated protein, TIGR04073 family [Candidatus Udaeobacter sp.]
MKPLAVFSLVFGLTGICLGDIQDPPANDYGPTRKLGRGLSNFFIAPTEFFVTVNQVNQTEGNSAGAGYGVWRGLGRSGARHVAGLIEILTFPFPIWHQSYYPLLPPDIPYIHAGYAEFPPEVGNESKYPYVRDSHQDFN